MRARIIDPYDIPRPRLFPAAVGTMTDRASGKLYPIHVHIANVGTDGTGLTSITASHYHRIKDGRVLPDVSDSHTHGITNLLASRRY